MTFICASIGKCAIRACLTSAIKKIREGKMQNVSHSLASGEKARLIPVVADTSKENRATSILLSTIMSVEALSNQFAALPRRPAHTDGCRYLLPKCISLAVEPW